MDPRNLDRPTRDSPWIRGFMGSPSSLIFDRSSSSENALCGGSRSVGITGRQSEVREDLGPL